MNLDWSQIAAYGGTALEREVPNTISALFSRWLIPRQEAYRKLSDSLTSSGELSESAAYAARVIVDKIKAHPEKVHLQVLWILTELADGNAWGATVSCGPLQGRLIDQLCRETIAELLPVLEMARGRLGKEEDKCIENLLRGYEDEFKMTPRPPPFWTDVVHFALAYLTEDVHEFDFDEALSRRFGLTLTEEASHSFWTGVHWGVFRASMGALNSSPTRGMNFLAWTSYQKALAAPNIISRLYPRELPTTPWICPACGEPMEHYLASCWKCEAELAKERVQLEERADMPLTPGIKALTFCLSPLFVFGWLFIIAFYETYKKRRYFRRQTEITNWFAGGLILWLILLLLLWRGGVFR